jgi:hypothetical protein
MNKFAVILLTLVLSTAVLASGNSLLTIAACQNEMLMGNGTQSLSALALGSNSSGGWGCWNKAIDQTGFVSLDAEQSSQSFRHCGPVSVLAQGQEGMLCMAGNDILVNLDQAQSKIGNGSQLMTGIASGTVVTPSSVNFVAVTGIAFQAGNGAGTNAQDISVMSH